MVGTRRWVRHYPRADGWRPTLGCSLPKRRPRRPNVGWRVTQSPTAPVQRWARTHPSAGRRRLTLGRVLPNVGSPRSNVRRSDTQAPIIGVHRWVQRYPIEGRRRLTLGRRRLTLDQRRPSLGRRHRRLKLSSPSLGRWHRRLELRPPSLGMARPKRQAPGRMFRSVCQVDASAGCAVFSGKRSKSAGEPRSASVAKIAAPRAGHTGLRSGSAFSLF